MNKLAAAAGLLILTSCSATPIEPIKPITPGAKYVAMGSSFSSGPGIGFPQPNSPARCGRSINNFASLLSSRLQTTLVDQGCNGATTQHILGPWNELPAQVDAVDASTELVTVLVGGNDIGYVGFLYMSGCEAGDVVKVGNSEYDCVRPEFPSEQAFEDVETGLKDIVVEIRSRAPRARIAFVQYLTMVPAEPCAEMGTTPEGAAAARQVAERLAKVTAEVASSTGSILIDADRMSADHTYCDPIPWSNGNIKMEGIPDGTPWHPKRAGHIAIADALVDKLTGDGAE